MQIQQFTNCFRSHEIKIYEIMNILQGSNFLSGHIVVSLCTFLLFQIFDYCLLIFFLIRNMHLFFSVSLNFKIVESF